LDGISAWLKAIIPGRDRKNVCNPKGSRKNCLNSGGVEKKESEKLRQSEEKKKKLDHMTTI